MDNRVLLAQARAAKAFRIAQSPDVVTRTRLTDPSDPWSTPIVTTDVVRISHERAGVNSNSEYPSGLDTSLSLYLQWRHDQTFAENDIITARGSTWKVGAVDPLKKFGSTDPGSGIIGYQAPLYPAGAV